MPIVESIDTSCPALEALPNSDTSHGSGELDKLVDADLENQDEKMLIVCAGCVQYLTGANMNQCGGVISYFFMICVWWV